MTQTVSLRHLHAEGVKDSSRWSKRSVDHRWAMEIIQHPILRGARTVVASLRDANELCSCPEVYATLRPPATFSRTLRVAGLHSGSEYPNFRTQLLVCVVLTERPRWGPRKLALHNFLFKQTGQRIKHPGLCPAHEGRANCVEAPALIIKETSAVP